MNTLDTGYYTTHYITNNLSFHTSTIQFNMKTHPIRI